MSGHEQQIDGQNFVDMLNGKIAPYRVKIECEWGSNVASGTVSEVEFFDFVILRSQAFIDSGQIQYRPHLRDKGPLLSYLSGHIPSTHLSWPVAYVSRLHRRSSSLAYFRAAKLEFLSRLVRHGVPHDIIRYVSNSTNYYLPYHECNTNVKRQRLPNTSYLVLPFHPIWLRSRLASVVSRFARDSQYRILLQQAFDTDDVFSVLTSWRLTSAPLGDTLVEW